MGEVIQFPNQIQQDLALAVGMEYDIVASQALPEIKHFADVVPIQPDLLTVGPDIQTDHFETKYACSTRALEALGQSALAGLDVERPSNQLYQEFTSSVGEMLKGDEEKGKHLEISRRDIFDFREGHVIAYDGETRVVDLVKAGAEQSKQSALIDHRMWTQHRRDKADIRNAEKVDVMLNDATLSNTRVVVSLEPKEAMERDGIEFWEEGLNYKAGLAYMQVYHRNNDGSLSTLTLSVDGSDKDMWRSLWGKRGVEIPKDETTDNWLDYALEEDLDDDEFEDFANSIRTEYYELVPDSLDRDSVEELLQDNQELVDQVFEHLYEPLGIALVSGKNSETIKDFAKESMKLDKIKTEIRQQLWTISLSETLEVQDIIILEQMVRYGLVEQLRDFDKTKERVKSDRFSHDNYSSVAFNNTVNATFERSVSSQSIIPPQILIRNIVGGISAGVEAGRSHGSCGSVTKLGQDSRLNDRLTDEIGAQDVFGGKVNETSEKSEVKDCEFISKVCPQCGEKNAKTRVVKGTYYHVGKSCKS